MPILSTETLRRRMADPVEDADWAQWLVVRPLLDPERQVKDDAIDLRLGTHFIATRSTRSRGLDPFDADLWSDIRSVQTQIVVPVGGEIVLHPGQFLLGTTVEYVRLPGDLAAYVTGRSSWGRLGLVIATAVAVHAGFAGCITLELANEGAVPIILRPGMRICQLLVHSLVIGEEELEARAMEGTYLGQTLSEYSRINDDDDIRLLRRLAHEDTCTTQ